MKYNKLLISLLAIIAILLLILAGILTQPWRASNTSVMKECASWRENVACLHLFWKTATEYDTESLDLQVRDASDLTSFMWATFGNENSEVIHTLPDAGANANTSNKYGQTALMLAARRNKNPEIISALLDAGMDTEVRDEFYNTARMRRKIKTRK